MKTLIKILFFQFSMFSFSSKAQSKVADSIFYIYVKPGDKLLQKLKYTHATAFNYLCKCQRGSDLHFVYQDKDGQYITDTLPKKFYTMTEFANFANNPKPKYRTEDLYFAKIYIVEYSDNRYTYYNVTFYPNPMIE